MGLFGGKKKEVIPEVRSSAPPPSHYQAGPPAQQQQQRGGPPPARASSVASSTAAPPSYRTNASSSYVPPSQGGSGYVNQPRYARQADPYQASKQRDELLAGAAPRRSAAAPSGPNGGAYGGIDGQQEQEYADEDEEVEGIKQQMRFVKQESLASTRNAVRIAREAEETGRATLEKLGEQSDRIANTERHLDMAKAYNDRAVDETKELEALNRSIFRPNFTWNKSAKRDKEERRIVARHAAEQAEREELRREQYESRMRIDNAYKGMDRLAENSAEARARARARGDQRQRYQFEATGSDDEVEDEIDNNLDELSGIAGRLKMLATATGQEVDAQNQKLNKIGGKVETLDTKVYASTQKLARIR